MMPNIFESKLTMEEALTTQWSQRTALSLDEPQNRGTNLPYLRVNGQNDVKPVVRPRRGCGY